ncbi:hypothetical protein GLOIN_2v1545487 [Rhizophagus irregularis DAOM 181602=DAOM 197198]|uniref:Uncharacterized protein n=1 Tax=Rhizophagus irregularis (strain DAOM 181602 / DAOM 197198 / MUCL 43194) TaxID=747089 RepID=A0A2P4QIU2_RHIID|nr:hypothetical protein GLOIN_2v1545487 [Rhizophagus irregularis DAOM 181602=DAOM 197198]POG77562.1 hypothetical protein GLOIN_2v1545487 [Rhizophagus irregularis DAOM 181602=DAOM 197198]|eukprot:XP_025184428.1 hypothetical protein GLOIN_2v1545487 [Rhizophagus irregularis DAOM 181602=DAOM 197198]
MVLKVLFTDKLEGPLLPILATLFFVNMDERLLSIKLKTSLFIFVGKLEKLLFLI